MIAIHPPYYSLGSFLFIYDTIKGQNAFHQLIVFSLTYMQTLPRIVDTSLCLSSSVRIEPNCINLR